jgi:hypothetical protein
MRWIKLYLTCIYIFQNKLPHCYFKFLLSICNSWINMVIFFIFRSSKINVSPTDIVSSIFPLRCCLSSGQRHHVTAPCHASFSLSQNELATYVLSSGNVLSRHLPSRAEIEALNPHRHHRLAFSGRLTLTFYYYKKIISTLVTLLITQLRIHFTSSLVIASRHRSYTSHRHSLLPLSHVHCPSKQQHPCRPSFASRLTYRHVNSHKKIF